MLFERIDYQNWDRREIFEYYRGTCMYVTMHLDITAFHTQVRQAGLRFYPAIIHRIATVINSHADYRHGLDNEAHVGIWETVHPLYTVPRKDDPRLFSMAVTPYQESFPLFYQSFLESYEKAEACGRLFADPTIPPNVMGISAMSNLPFSSFAFGDAQPKPDLIPFVVLGKYTQESGRTILPICGEFAHALNDGYHIEAFFRLLGQVLQQPIAPE